MQLDRREEMNDNQSNNDGVGTQARRRGALHVFVRIHYCLMCIHCALNTRKAKERRTTGQSLQSKVLVTVKICSQ